MSLKKFILSIICFTLSINIAFSQKDQIGERTVLYVFDSESTVQTRSGQSPFDDINVNFGDSDIFTVSTLTDTNEMNRLGFKADTVIFITTAVAHNRTIDERSIPTSKKIEFKNHLYYLKGQSNPYTGQIISHYFNGKKASSLKILNGIAVDTVYTYYEDGISKKGWHNLKDSMGAKKSVAYFLNGKIKTKGNLVNNKADGCWDEWYSTGAFKRTVLYKSGRIENGVGNESFYKFYYRGLDAKSDKAYSAAIKLLDKAINIKSDFADAYFTRGLCEILLQEYDDAITDFSKALELEPYYSEALAERATARIKRYEISYEKNSVLTDKQNEEKIRICDDLTKLYLYEYYGVEISKIYLINNILADFTEKRKQYCKWTICNNLKN